MIRQSKSQQGKSRERRGATVVEIAMILPLLFTLFWGFWEWSRVEMIRQAAATAAYEGARRGILPGATINDMETMANEKLIPYSVSDAVITPSIDNVTNRASVEITIPLKNNLWGSGRFLADRNIVSKFELRRE